MVGFRKLSLVLTLALMFEPETGAVERKLVDAVFSVTSSTGQRLGLMTLPTAASFASEAAETLFESPAGRVLVATYRREAGLNWIAYRDASSGEELVVWTRADFGRDGGRVPTVFVFGEGVFGWSLPKRFDRDAVSRRNESLRSWLAARSPDFVALLKDAVAAAIVVERGRIEAPNPATYMTIVRPLVPLYAGFGPSAFGTARKGDPGGILVPVGPESADARRVLVHASGVVAPKLPQSDYPRRWSGDLVGGREEAIGSLRLDWTGNAEPGRLAATVATLAWSEGRRSEKASLVFFGPAGGYFGRIERKVGGDWATVVTFEGFGEVEGEGWWAPFRIGDRMAKEESRAVVEIPPSGEQGRQRARSALLDAFLAALGRSGLSEPEAAETLYRWQRTFNLPKVKESLPSIVPLADVLAGAPIPVFRNEVDEPWAGTVDLRDVVAR
jgi:hypothetical protein